MRPLNNLSAKELESVKPRLADDFDLTRLPLTPEQAFMLTRITGSDSLHALARVSPLGYERTLEWFEELLASGVLTATGLPDAPPPSNAAAPTDPWQNERAALKSGAPLTGPLYRILLPLGIRNANGTFLLEADGILYRLAIAQGALTGMDSSQPSTASRIGDLLRQSGQISEAELEWAAGEAKRLGKRLGEQLVHMGLVTENDIRQTLIRQTGNRVTGLLDRRQGRTCFIEHRPPEDTPTGTALARLVVQHLRHNAPDPPADWIPYRQGRKLLAMPPGAPAPSAFGLDLAEQYLLEEVAAGNAPLEAISIRRGMALDALENLVMLFIELGLLRIENKLAEQAAPTRPPKVSGESSKVERLAATPPAPNTVAPPKEVAKPRKAPAPAAAFPSLEEMLKRLEKKDYFELMEVHWSAPVEKMDQACRQRITELDKHLAGLNTAERKAWEPVVEKFRQIRSTLVDRESRIEYRKGAMDSAQRLASAHIEFEKGETALFVNRDFATAVGHLETASELDPDDKAYLYSHWLAQALRAREQGDTARSNQLVEKILGTARTDPADSAAWQYTGYVYLQSKKEREAKDAFLKALKADPDNAEAKKELDRMK